MPVQPSIVNDTAISFYINHQRYASTSTQARGSLAVNTPKEQEVEGEMPFKNSIVVHLVNQHSKTLSNFKKIVRLKKSSV